ncbi:MAG: hypothetical protein ACOCVM_01650 [Desulfovibrionaceae bacterium]
MLDEPVIKDVRPTPEFDLQQFMNIYGENRVQQELMDKILAKWPEWTGRVVARVVVDAVKPKPRGTLLLYLDKQVEDEVDAVWTESPSEGMALHSLAVALVMSAAASVVQELGDGQCAPVPKPNAAMRGLMQELELDWNPEEGTVNRKYALLTPAPYRGGCEICFLSGKCPKALYG